MDLAIDIGIAALLRMLRNKKQIQQWLPALAKVFVAIENTADLVPDLAAAIEKKRMELGITR